MSVLVDTGVLHAFLNRRDRHHDAAVAFMDEAMDAVHGRLVTTPFVVDEAISLARVRKQPVEAAEDLLAMIGLQPDSDLPKVLHLVDITVNDLPAVVVHQRRYWDRGLSFTDCTNLHIMERERLDALATFDGGFDGLVPVVPGQG